ncbi:MAG TPA: metalloprotease family protein [Holophagaceae bacterium]
MLRRLLAFLTFPGIVAHEFAHAWACRRLGVRVHRVCYLRFGNPMGYVLHEAPANALQHIAIAVAPFFVSTTLALAASLAGCLLARSPFFPGAHDAAAVAAAWLGFALALHAFPSAGDGDALWDDVKRSGVSLFAKLLLIPVVGVIRLAQAGTRFWLDALFALCIVALPPAALLAAMA